MVAATVAGACTGVNLKSRQSLSMGGAAGLAVTIGRNEGADDVVAVAPWVISLETGATTVSVSASGAPE
jgi:hypothetical protein